MSKFGVTIDKHNEIRKLMRKAQVFEKDLKESFVHSSGPGGMNVNKVATCVVLEHNPTGITVKCQKERTQGLNRYHARLLLVKKIEKLRRTEAYYEQHEREKAKRRDRRRPQQLKEEVLKDKHLQSEKKALRKKIKVDAIEEE
ncbi:MAG: peptide chain release factor-like protein [Candidatus Omnitrophica bacterium]|nr:peptide chain release factor-like protein [Candidatus Omnitrophota bacterium]